MRLHALGLRLVLIVSLSAGVAFAAHAVPPKQGRPAAVTVSHPPDKKASMRLRTDTTARDMTTMALFASQLDALYAAVRQAEIEEAARAAEAERVENERREAAARAAASRPARPAASEAVAAPAGTCGGATNGADQFIARESGGNPAIYNTGGSGAWGCYQIMPGTWAGSCSDLGQHGSASPEQQAACASRLPLSAWR